MIEQKHLFINLCVIYKKQKILLNSSLNNVCLPCYSIYSQRNRYNQWIMPCQLYISYHITCCNVTTAMPFLKHAPKLLPVFNLTLYLFVPQVDTEVCEQTFSWLSNHKKMTQKMSRSTFMFFLLYVCELHNRRENDKLARANFM